MDLERKKEILGKLVVINTAYEAGQINIRTAKRYRTKLAKEDHIWYLITYVADRKCIYDGAFELKISAQIFLGDKLNAFLLYQLATQL